MVGFIVLRMTQQNTDPSSLAETQTQGSTSLKRLFFKTSLITLGFLSLFFVITAIFLLLYLWNQWDIFSKTAGTNFAEVRNVIETGWNKPLDQTNGYKNILLLGVDYLSNRGGTPALTDTMMIVSLNTESGVIKTLPLPRDIWNQDYQTKINALLVYGPDQTPENPKLFPAQVLSEMSGVPFHHTVVISLETLSSLVDAVGGIDVEVEQAFTDTTFPRTDVDITTETDPEKLYKTVSFAEGRQMMDGERALTFIRSRHSSDDEGTDLARSQRQQKVITALVDKVRDPQTIANPETMGLLYRLYLDSFSEDISPPEVIAILKKLYPVRNDITFENLSLSVSDTQTEGVIEHPPVRTNQYQGQWVYIIPNLGLFQEEVSQLLFSSPN